MIEAFHLRGGPRSSSGRLGQAARFAAARWAREARVAARAPPCRSAVRSARLMGRWLARERPRAPSPARLRRGSRHVRGLSYSARCRPAGGRGALSRRVRSRCPDPGDLRQRGRLLHGDLDLRRKHPVRAFPALSVRPGSSAPLRASGTARGGPGHRVRAALKLVRASRRGCPCRTGRGRPAVGSPWDSFSAPLILFVGQRIGMPGQGLGILGGGYGAVQMAISGSAWLREGWNAVLMLLLAVRGQAGGHVLDGRLGGKRRATSRPPSPSAACSAVRSVVPSSCSWATLGSTRERSRWWGWVLSTAGSRTSR